MFRKIQHSFLRVENAVKSVTLPFERLWAPNKLRISTIRTLPMPPSHTTMIIITRAANDEEWINYPGIYNYKTNAGSLFLLNCILLFWSKQLQPSSGSSSMQETLWKFWVYSSGLYLFSPSVIRANKGVATDIFLQGRERPRIHRDKLLGIKIPCWESVVWFWKRCRCTSHTNL